MKVQVINTGLNAVGLFIWVIVTFSEYIGVLGQRPTRFAEGSLRLVGGREKHEGTVLIYHWSRWGAICDDYWDLRDASVVCKELGYTGAVQAPRRSRFGKGRRRVWLSGLHCRGHERHITMCFSRGWGNTGGRHCRSKWSSAGVVCNPKPATTTTTTTTTTQRPPNSRRRLPLILDVERPDVVLRANTPEPRKRETTTKRPTTERPTTSAPETERPTTERPMTRRPTTSAPETERPTTRRTTTRLTRATRPHVYNRWVYNSEMWRYYMYLRDGSHVTSRPDPRYFERMKNTTTTSTTTTTTTTTTTPKPPRRMDNSIPNNVNMDPNTNTNRRDNVVYDTLFNTSSRDVSISNEVPQAPSRQSTDNQLTRHEDSHSNSFGGKEGYVGDQPIPGVTSDEEVNADSENEQDEAGTTTTTTMTTSKPKTTTTEPSTAIPTTRKPTMAPRPAAPDYDEYRVRGGREYSGYLEGRIEVRVAGSNTWGVICGDHWDFRATLTACRHFGIGYGRTAQQVDFYGGSNMDKVVANLKCHGKEERLEDCTKEFSQDEPGKVACSKASSVAGIVCETRLPDLELDLPAIEHSAFLQDRYLYYLQCAYEENCLATAAADIYETSTWRYATRRLLRFSTIAKNIGTADFRPHQDRSQWEWHACHQHYHSMDEFSHYDIVDPHGNKVAEGHKASFCLEDTACDRGVFPKYQCQQFGNQGISVGCQDSYLADIDCQWIDVTDVKPGHYTFKVEINPTMGVAETSFDNNVARCNLYFNTLHARIYNCTLDSLL